MTDFRKLGEQVGQLVAEKQIAYGDSFGHAGQVLEILYPNGVVPSQYGTFLAVTRVIDKLFRVATRKDAFGESPWKDIAGYALLGLAKEIDSIPSEDVAERLDAIPVGCGSKCLDGRGRYRCDDPRPIIRPICPPDKEVDF